MPKQAPVERVRRIAMQMPGATERLSHGEPTFFINDKKTFTMTVNDHHGDGIVGFWCPAPVGEQAARIEEDPEVFFRPPYVGGRGWIGVKLNVSSPPSDETLHELIEDAWRHVAPKRLLAEYDRSTQA